MAKTEHEEKYQLCYEDKFSIEDLENRHLYLSCEVDDIIAHEIVYYIMRFNRLDGDMKIEERKPIYLYINSPGGSVTSGFSIIDAITTSRTPVYTVNLGTAYSMGFLIFLAGEKKFAMPNSTFLCHDGSTMAWDSMNKVKDRVEFETKQLEAHVKAHVLGHSTITSELYDQKKRIEWYMFPEEAKEHGVVTHIVGYDCVVSDIM